MLRHVLFMGVLAGILATGHAAFADPAIGAAPDHARTATPDHARAEAAATPDHPGVTAAATEQMRPAATTSPSSAAPEPANAVGSDDIIPVGSGWG